MPWWAITIGVGIVILYLIAGAAHLYQEFGRRKNMRTSYLPNDYLIGDVERRRQK